MHVFSPAFTMQAEIINSRRWDDGPLELVFANEPEDQCRFGGAVIDWHHHHRSGWARPSDTFDYLHSTCLPGLDTSRSPNLFVVPQLNGYTELHVALASLLPAQLLSQHGLTKSDANFWLWPFSMQLRMPTRTDSHNKSWLKESLRAWPIQAATYAEKALHAFQEYLWTKMAHRRSHLPSFLAPDSSIRLLAGDNRFWMHRLYRIALDLYEWLDEVDHEKDSWEPLAYLRDQVMTQLPADKRSDFSVTRPKCGGLLWDTTDDEQCEDILYELISGNHVLESLEPVLEVLNSHRAHEDFSDCYSWVKEDFERSFYSKRSKIKVSLCETLDDYPAWSAHEQCGHGDALFRDVLAVFDERDQRIILALRHGRTQTEISEDIGLKGHAVISRRVKVIKQRFKRLLAN